MSYPTKSGLNAAQRIAARRRIKKAAYLWLDHAPEIHYSQDAVLRWEGITKHLRSYRGEYARHADCSSFATYVHWDGTLRWKPKDYVNGQSWKAGYTGTQEDCGRRVTGRTMVGDLVQYGGHVAVVVRGARTLHDTLVISHGSEAGPFLLRADYRPVAQVRRYL